MRTEDGDILSENEEEIVDVENLHSPGASSMCDSDDPDTGTDLDSHHPKHDDNSQGTRYIININLITFLFSF